MAKENVIGRIRGILDEYLKDRGLEIYNVEYRKEGPDWKLRVVLDKPMGSEEEFVNIDECEDVTRYLSDQLDELNLIDRKYTLEVSSPGLDRELMKDSDFVRFTGRIVDVKLYEPMRGSKTFEAELAGKEGDSVIVKIDGETVKIPKGKISKISLAVIF